MRAIYVPLAEPVRQALNDLAEREYRDPRDQATKLISDALRQAGALPSDDRLATTAPHGRGEAA